MLLILGASGLAGRIHTPIAEAALELFALGGMTLIAAVEMATRRTVGRIEAVVMLVGYVVFLSLLGLR